MTEDTPLKPKRRRWRWLVVALLCMFSMWIARAAWQRHGEGVAAEKLIEQGMSVGREDLFPIDVKFWLRDLGIESPQGHVTSVSYDGAAVISNLTYLSGFPRLEILMILPGNDGRVLSEAAQASLARTPPCKRLVNFTVEMPTGFRDDFFKRFSQCPDLEEFAVVAPNLTDEGICYLAHCPKLSYLSIPKCRVRRGLNLLSLKSLKKFIANGTAIDSAGLQGLRDCTQLEFVDLVGTNVDDAGMEILAELPALKTLFLNRTHVTSVGIARLLATSKVELLGATDTAVTMDDAIELSKGLEGLTIFVGTQNEPIRIERGAVM